MNLLYVTNGAAVGIFGMVLSGAFCDIHWTKEKREFLVGSFCAACHTGRDVSVGRGSDDPLSLSCDHTCPDVYCPLHFNEKTSVDSDFRADCLSLLSASQVGGTFYNGCVCEQ